MDKVKMRTTHWVVLIFGGDYWTTGFAGMGGP